MPRISATIPSASVRRDFLVGVKLDRIAPLGVERTEEAVLPSAEREVGHRSGDPDIDPDIAGRHFVPELAGRRAAGGENGCLIPVRAVRNQGNGVVNVGRVYDTQYRTEDLGIDQLTTRRESIQQRRPHEVAALVCGNPRAASVQERLRALADALAISRSTRSLLAAVITGPICTPSDRTRRASRWRDRRSFSENDFRASPTVTTTETARQRWPAQPNAPSAMICEALSMSASGSTTA